VDVGAQAAIWDHLRAARVEGLAVLLISADLDELIGLSDSIKVILRGRLVADADPGSVTPEELGSAMTGAGDHAQQPEPAAAGTGPAGSGPTDSTVDGSAGEVEASGDARAEPADPGADARPDQGEGV
jgi:simple sugar transport system ATP-binding protein